MKILMAGKLSSNTLHIQFYNVQKTNNYFAKRFLKTTFIR